jgi:hypothetical protein
MWKHVPCRPVLLYHIDFNSDRLREYFTLQFFVNRLESVGDRGWGIRESDDPWGHEAKRILTRPRFRPFSLAFANFLSTVIALPPAETKESGLLARASDRP